MEYWKEIPWYVYILFIGLALIVFAMFDEKRKQNKKLKEQRAIDTAQNVYVENVNQVPNPQTEEPIQLVEESTKVEEIHSTGLQKIETVEDTSTEELIVELPLKKEDTQQLKKPQDKKNNNQHNNQKRNNYNQKKNN